MFLTFLGYNPSLEVETIEIRAPTFFATYSLATVSVSKLVNNHL